MSTESTARTTTSSTRPAKSRGSRLRKATALLPLALLSAAWTASILGVQAPAAVSAARPDTTLPDGTSVPSQAIEAPASVSDGSALGVGTDGQDAQQIVATASTSGIPSAALAAYQRAETVINAADPTCHLQWQLVAAIGRVESNHGRANGNTLSDDGVATPGIYGVALNGANATSEILDTDAGQYDQDAQYDRAVGPMQFIPSTWSVVGVDADGDGVRNPQDIDDAALGTAVYLCSGEDDLGTDAGRQAAVFRYNHSQSYVDLVLAIMQAYLDGDFTSVPNGTVMAGELAPVRPQAPLPTSGPDQQQGDSEVRGNGGNDNGGPSTPTPTATPTPTPTSSPTPAAPTSAPTQNGGGGGNGGNGGGGGLLNGGGGGGSSQGPGSQPVTIPPLPTTSIGPVDGVLTGAQAVVQCTLDGLTQLLNPTAWQACIDHYTGK